MDFIDFRKFEECEIPSQVYGKIANGINIYGICNSKKCPAYGKESIASLKGVKTFVLNEEILSIKCPECNLIIKPLTVGFYLCNYKIEGEYIYGGIIKKLCINGKSEKDKMIKYYNPNNNEKYTFIKLIIKVS